MTQFRGAHVFITGAASGLGRLMALEAARRGARVSLVDRDATGLAEVCAAIQGEKGDARDFVVDLSDRAAIQATCAEVLETRGGVDILINNAGVVSGKPLLECSDEAIERTFQVNALALFWTVRAFLPGMTKTGKGHIVTVASAAGLAGTARLVDYSASKFAAVGFDESLRMELKRLGSPVRTTVVCPFFIDTGMFEGVKTRFAWLLPILQPGYVVGRIMGAIEGNRARLIMPRFVMTVPVVRVLPPFLFDAVLAFFGVNRSMDEFVGRH
ncbi:short-chain dehydrogenase [Geothrix oryzae]|uniref:Short-chain dehydrogenase n=1 Tax=Geothrix oryzae TaxID=2927975 RepID=A0ABM8DR90_9BACT|nr:SDR family oxidoreductase [Geothrix oryzae]BDU69412.1 short-chain dehydrogenase [Geothrix oryzae]